MPVSKYQISLIFVFVSQNKNLSEFIKKYEVYPAH